MQARRKEGFPIATGAGALAGITLALWPASSPGAGAVLIGTAVLLPLLGLYADWIGHDRPTRRMLAWMSALAVATLLAATDGALAANGLREPWPAVIAPAFFLGAAVVSLAGGVAFVEGLRRRRRPGLGRLLPRLLTGEVRDTDGTRVVVETDAGVVAVPDVRRLARSLDTSIGASLSLVGWFSPATGVGPYREERGLRTRLLLFADVTPRGALRRASRAASTAAVSLAVAALSCTALQALLRFLLAAAA